MRRIFAGLTMASVLFMWVCTATAKNDKAQWNLRDLYFFDEQGTMQRMNLAPKLIVRFLEAPTPEARDEFISKVSPLTQEQYNNDSLQVVLGFSPTTGATDILGKLNELNQSSAAEAVPVFLVENIEAVADGIVVHPKITISADLLIKRLKRLGEFRVFQSVSEKDAWVFFIEELKSPSNFFVLANLANKDPWIKKAYPHFRYLHDPITTSMRVEPISGTIGEERKLIWEFRIFKPEIQIDENLLPAFGEGSFVPMVSNSVPDLFFRAIGKRERDEPRDRRARIITFSWKFALYVVGESIIANQPVSYKIKGETKEMRTNAVTVVVTSLVGNLMLDFPPPREIPVTQPNELRGEIQPPPSPPQYWFDSWIGDQERAVFYGYRIALLLGVAGAIVLCPLLVRPLRRAKEKERQFSFFRHELEVFLAGAEESLSYQKLDEAAHKILRAAFPELSPNSTIEQIEKCIAEGDGGLEETMPLLRSVFKELQERHKPDFVPGKEYVQKIIRDVRTILSHLEQIIRERLGGTP